jgi:glycosyltransferase involved in cell wall biosynthesis
MKPRIAVVHPLLFPGGGSEACAMWTLQALQDEYATTLITMGHPDLRVLNRSYGTSVDAGRIELRTLAIPPGLGRRFDALRGVRLARYCRRRAGDFELMISAYNVMDFGAAGIQHIADFSFDDALRRELDFEDGKTEGLFHRRSPARTLYLKLAAALAGTDGAGWGKNRTVANSEWTRALLLERLGLDSEVIYPPVSGATSDVPWERREDGFVVMARLVPEKRIELIISVLAEVRQTKPIHLHILGRRGRSGYARRLEALCRALGDWVHLEGEAYGTAKAALLAGHKYGISGRRAEAFGIAVAEMVKAGMIVWVPDDGGQTEIVGDSGLTFAGRDQAVSRILSVLTDPGREAALRRQLEARSAAFSSSRFVSETQALVRDVLKKGATRGA